MISANELLAYQASLFLPKHGLQLTQYYQFYLLRRDERLGRPRGRPSSETRNRTGDLVNKCPRLEPLDYGGPLIRLLIGWVDNNDLPNHATPRWVWVVLEGRNKSSSNFWKLPTDSKRQLKVSNNTVYNCYEYRKKWLKLPQMSRKIPGRIDIFVFSPQLWEN